MDSLERTLEDRAAKALEAPDSVVRGVFCVCAHGTYSNVVVCEHNYTRASQAHIYEDLRDAERVLRAAGFEAWYAGGWSVCARAAKV